MEEILMGLAKLSPLVAVFVAIILYLLKQDTKKENQVDALTKELRESEKENLIALQKVTLVMEKMTQGNADILQEVKTMRASLEAKIDKIK